MLSRKPEYDIEQPDERVYATTTSKKPVGIDEDKEWCCGIGVDTDALEYEDEDDYWSAGGGRNW